MEPKIPMRFVSVIGWTSFAHHLRGHDDGCIGIDPIKNQRTVRLVNIPIVPWMASGMDFSCDLLGEPGSVSFSGVYQTWKFIQNSVG